jgi:hypothetical protein
MLADVLARMSLRQLKALHRVCKTRGYAFFKDPRATMALRREIEIREELIYGRKNDG